MVTNGTWTPVYYPPRLTSIPFYGWITDWYHALWSADTLMPPISVKLVCSWCVEKIKEWHRAMGRESMVSTTGPDGVERIQLGSNIADCEQNVQHEQSTYAEVLPITLTEQSYTMPQDTTMIKKKSESLLFHWPWSFKAKPCWFPYVNDPTAGHNPHWSQRFGQWLIINTGSNMASELRVEKQMIIDTKLAAKWCDWLLRGTGERSIWTNRSYTVAVSGWGGKGMDAAWFLDMRGKSAVTQEERYAGTQSPKMNRVPRRGRTSLECTWLVFQIPAVLSLRELTCLTILQLCDR